ncbi:MAG: DEAD/DEAH box helicase [Alphaproteobacteria bacterium]|nr:DEAD/DEAH box helicase [Alphaproteobacteria bacterium]
MSFSELGLSPDTLRAIDEAGYSEPTPIQAKAIPVALMGRDILGCAQTGTGKTAGFTLPMIEILDAGRARARMPRSLILEPTRELAAQVSESFETYGKYHNLSKALLIGGTSFGDQQRALARGVDVLIATPGRLIDLFERGNILLSDVKVLVIDESDRMLDMGFVPDVERIVSLLPKIRQTLFFSATMPPEIRRLADKFLMNPKEISVDPPATAAVTVSHFVATVSPRGKHAALRALIGNEEISQAIIFCNRKRDIGPLVKDLSSHGMPASPLHGDMDQHLRTKTLDDFRNNNITLLVASDVAARGLDVTNVSHVFNYDVPSHADDYVHRIGRTGRAGREGRALMLATPEDGKYLDAITRLLGKKITPIEISGVKTSGVKSAPPGEKAEATETREPSHREPRRRSRSRKPAQKRNGERKPRSTAKTAPSGDGAKEGAKDESAPAKSASEARPESKSRDKSRTQRPKKENAGAAGMGDDTPAFLLRQLPGDKPKK